MLVLDVVVPLFMWVVDFALGCTGFVDGTAAGRGSIWFKKWDDNVTTALGKRIELASRKWQFDVSDTPVR